jgi:SAM-dependent methyltransferase
MGDFDPVWDEIYEGGRQLNKYPYTSIVSFLMSKIDLHNIGSQPKVIEIGCGAGNNLWFAAREGFDVTGIDASVAAINYAKARFSDEGLKGRFDVGDFVSLPYPDDTFDIALDRAALSQVPKNSAKATVMEISRVTKSGGTFYSEIYSDRATSRGKITDGGLLVDVEGPYSGVGQIGFYSKSEVLELYDEHMEVLHITHTETMDALNKPAEIYAHWSVVARVI